MMEMPVQRQTPVTGAAAAVDKHILARRLNVKRLHHVMDWEDALLLTNRVGLPAVMETSVHQGTSVMERVVVLARAIFARRLSVKSPLPVMA